ncbi:hypothetical protein BH20ACT6_BH20ACT6_19020 [soil metagenome]
MTAPTSNDPVEAPTDPASEATPAGAELADDVVVAVMALPGVDAMHSGRFGEVATHLPGRRIAGVRVRADVVEVHVTATWGADLPPLADSIRAAAQPVAGRAVHVVIQDVRAPLDSDPAARG